MAMPEGAFTDSKRKPTAPGIRRALGRSAGAWDELLAWMAERFPPLTLEWGFADENWGWILKVSRTKRTIVRLIPREKRFRAAIILGEKAVRQVLAEGLPAPAAQALRQARKYPEGRIMPCEIRFKRELPPVKQMLDAKMSR
jgi:hypothetical protein